MATLTQTAYFARKTIKYGGIALVFLILLRASYITIKKLIPPKPVPPPPPNIAFGKLPKIEFPEKEILFRINYRLETISGSLPKLDGQAKVYFMPESSVGFLSQEKIENWAKLLKFNQKPQKIDGSEFENLFTLSSPVNTTLKVNVLTRNFTFTYDWRSDPGFSFQPAPDANQSISLAAGFLESAQSLPSDINPANNKIVYLKNESNNLVESIPQEANFSKVNFYRQTADSLKILPPDLKNANIYIIISPIKNNYNGIVEARYIHNIISTEINATYPLKDVNQAWTQLLEGKGYIANIGDNPEGNIIVRNAYLAYYEGEKPQGYLQPIVVFEGDRDFTAYVPAITDNLFTD